MPTMRRAILFLLSSLQFFVMAMAEQECRDMNGRTVSHGSHYVQGPDTCTLCICDHGEPKWCKAVLCSPPQHCKSFRVGNSCCEFICLDDTLSNDNPPDLGLKLVAGSIATIIFLSILLVMFHRLRQRKLRSSQHRQQSEDQRSLASIGYIDGSMAYMSAMCDEGHINYPVWKPPGNYFPRGEAPPPYDEAVAQARAEAGVRNTNEQQIGFHRSFSASHTNTMENILRSDDGHNMPLRNQQHCYSSGANIPQQTQAPILGGLNVTEQHFSTNDERHNVRMYPNASLVSSGNQSLVNPMKLSHRVVLQSGAVPRGSLGRSAGEGVFLRMLPAAYIPIGNNNSLTQHITQMHRTIPRMPSAIDNAAASNSAANMHSLPTVAALERRSETSSNRSGGVTNQYDTSDNGEIQNTTAVESGSSHRPSSRTLGKLMGLFSELQPDKTNLPLIVDKPSCGCSYDCDPPPLTDDADDYHSECENCKSSTGSRYYLDDCEEEDEGTMTLQRHLTTTTSTTPAAASATLPGSTKQRHRSISSGNRENWFSSIPGSSSSEEE